MKKVLSLLLCMVMLFSCITTEAINIKVNENGELKDYVASDTEFFNIKFTDINYKPNAEQVYTITLSNSIELWRYSSGTWWTPWGNKNDTWIQKLMDGKVNPLTTVVQDIPSEVLSYINNGGSWNDVKVTFQCVNVDGIDITPSDIFKDGKVDCYIKSGKTIEVQFYPVFRTDTYNKVFEGNKLKLNRGIYPYSYTVFSMWDKSGSHRHYGATRVYDGEHGEPEEKYSGFNVLTYKDILNNKGHIKSGLNLKNIQYPAKTETGQTSSSGISTDKAKIGSGTFNSGGATGLGFSFPIRVTFEINPQDNTKLLTEVGLVNLQDNANTLANVQMYSDRDGFMYNLKFVGGDRVKTILSDKSSLLRTNLVRLIVGADNYNNEEHLKAANNYVDKMLSCNGLTDELVYKYFTSLGNMDVFTEDEQIVIRNDNMRMFLDTCLLTCASSLYTAFVSDYFNDNLTTDSKDIKEVTYNSKQGVFIGFGSADNSYTLSGQLKNYMDKSVSMKGIYALPVMTYYYDNKVITEDTIRKYAMLNTKEIAEHLTDMSHSGLYEFVEDNYVLCGETLNEKTGYYRISEENFSHMIQALDNLVGEYSIYDINKNVVKLEDTGVLLDSDGGFYRIEDSSALKIRSNNVTNAIGFALSAYVDYEGISFEPTETANKLKYTGTYSYTPIISDYGCDVKMDVVRIGADGSINTLLNNMFIGTVNRFDSFNDFNAYIKHNGNYIYSSDGINYKPVLLAYSEKTEREIDTIVKNFLNTENHIKEGVIEIDGVKIIIGDSAMEKASVYASEKQLKSQEDINIRTYVRDLSDTLLSVTYVDTNENHIETKISKAVITDNKVWAGVNGGYENSFDFIYGYVSTEKPEQGLNEKTTWDMISACEPYDEQWLTEPGYINVDETKEQVVYVKAKQKAPEPNVTGDFVIGQQRISKAFETIDVYKPQLGTTYTVNSSKHKRRYYCSSKNCSGHWEYCSINNTSSDTYNIVWNVSSDADNKIQAMNYGTRLFNNTTGARTLNRVRGTNDSVNANMKFVLWRGYDKPIASSYADTGYNADVWNKFGIGSSNKYSASGTNGNYTKKIQLKYREDNSSDNTVNFRCSFGKTHSGSVSGKSRTTNTSLAVNTYSGWKGQQTATSGGTTGNTINGIIMTNMFKGTISQNNINFFPYVNMKYEDMDGDIRDLNVLSKYESKITPISTVEYGFKKGSDDSLNITSNMWSTHQRAVSSKGKNNVLVGGATYKLNDNTTSKLPAVGITTYSWYVPNDATNAVYSGVSGNTQSDAENRHKNAVKSLKDSIVGNQIRQVINVNGSNYYPTNGANCPWLNNIKYETDAKYWFGNLPVNTQVVPGTEVNTADYYRIYSDTQGNVYLMHGNNLDYTFNKWNTNEYILSQLNTEWKDINEKTGLVSCYLGSIIRNSGNDKEFVYDGAWYNEAFPGLCVVKQQTTFCIGLNGQIKNKDNVVNLRYIAGGTTSKADIFKNYNLTYFISNNTELKVKYGSKNLSSGTINLNFRTRNWWIPNATVYDND